MMRHPTAAHDRRRFLLLDQGATATPYKRPLKGAIRKLQVPIADPHFPKHVMNTWADDSGVRRILGCSDFCLVTDWKYNNAIARHDIDYAAQFYHYIRAFRRLGESATSGYFGHRSVLMPWCIDEFWNCVEYGARYDMRWQVTLGYQFTSHQEVMDFEGEWARRGQERGLSRYLFLIEKSNEYWQNDWLRGNLEKCKEEGYQLQELWRSIFNPCPFVCMGAPESEGPDLILASMLSDYVCEIHTARDREWMLKHVFALHYMEGHPGYLIVDGQELAGPYYVCGEPTPASGGPDDFMGVDNSGAQLGQLSMQGAIGATSTYFDGWDVRSEGPIEEDAPTFESYPIIMSKFPEDICTWGPEHGGSIWHWRQPHSDKVLTVLDEVWYSGYRPPKPWGQWTAYGVATDWDGTYYPTGTMLTGTGKVSLPPGFGGATVYGEM